ncbi:MAG: DUF2911 domain-containing protein [Acidimicrobiales bacterium]|nr:MAG: DUF2911 domain-containing protein [Acidimicrobiales bacterium]
MTAMAVGAAGLAMAQDLHPSRRPSPMGMARITVDDTYMRVVYSRPYKRGRDNIFGTEASDALVPYGKIWRTGANEATELTVTGDVMVGDQKLAAGTYSLFTVPGPESWTVHINSALGLSGTGRFVDGKFTPVDIPASDVVVATAAVGTLEEEVEQFTIAWKAADGGADMCLQWITTEVCVPFRK